MKFLSTPRVQRPGQRFAEKERPESDTDMDSRHNSATHPAEADRIYRRLLGPVLERGTLWSILYVAAFASLGGAVSWIWS